MNRRAKGLRLCHEVKGILQEMGHKVEWPGYDVAFFKGGVRSVHKDYFGVFDLLSIGKDGQLIGHQVSVIGKKAEKVRKMQGVGANGWFWGKVPRSGFKVFVIGINAVQDAGVILSRRAEGD